MLRTTATIMSLGLMGLCLTLTPIAPAQAGPVVTFTETGTFSQSFSDDTVVCQTELYTVTVEGHSTEHLTARTDADGNIIRRYAPGDHPRQGDRGAARRHRGDLPGQFASPSTWRRSGACGTAR